MSDNNREACAAATKPLIDSVESLTAYALSPEFAPVPAKISEEVRKLFWSRLLSQLWVVHTAILDSDNCLSFYRNLRTVTLILLSFLLFQCFFFSIVPEITINKVINWEILSNFGTGGKKLCDNYKLGEFVSWAFHWKGKILQHFVQLFFRFPVDTNIKSFPSPQSNTVVLPPISPTTWFFKPIFVTLGIFFKKNRMPFYYTLCFHK